MSFSYDQDLSFAFEGDAGSDVPPVNELFGGFIGSYQYSAKPPNTKDCGSIMLSATGTSSPSHAHRSVSPDNLLILEDRNNQAGSGANGSKRGEPEITDCDEVDTALN